MSEENNNPFEQYFVKKELEEMLESAETVANIHATYYETLRKRGFDHESAKEMSVSYIAAMAHAAVLGQNHGEKSDDSHD